MHRCNSTAAGPLDGFLSLKDSSCRSSPSNPEVKGRGVKRRVGRSFWQPGQPGQTEQLGQPNRWQDGKMAQGCKRVPSAKNAWRMRWTTKQNGCC